MKKMKVVIIGNGISGNHVAFSLKEHDSSIEVTILSKEESPEYDPCSLTYFIGKDVPRETIFRRTLSDYKKNGINLILGDPAISIDSDNKTITTKSGKQFIFDKLVLAQGGELFIPPFDGTQLNGVFGCKSIVDADNLFSRNSKNAVVVGSGAIGIEAAEALKKRGANVTIIELLDWILPTMFDEIASRKLEHAFEGYGIRVLTGEKVLKIQGKEKVDTVVTNKREIHCDTVVLATGVVTDKLLPSSANIEIDRGIVTNSKMETSSPNIYACGDCAQTWDVTTGESCMYQLKHNALDQASVVTQNILSNITEYEGAYSFARAHFFDTHSASFGKTMRMIEQPKEIEIIERNEGENYLQVILKNGRIVGAQAVGEISDDIGMLMASAWRKDDIIKLKKDWSKVCSIDSNSPWTIRQLGVLLGFDYYPEY